MKSVSTVIMSVVAVLIILTCVAIPIIGQMSETTGERVYSDNSVESTKMARATSLSSAITLEKTADGVTANGTATTSYVIVSSSIAVSVGVSAVSWIHTNGTDPTTTGNLAWDTGDKLVFNGTAWSLTPGQGTSTAAASGSFSWIYYPSDAGTYILVDTENSGAVNVDSGKEIVTVGFLSTTKQCVLTGTVSSLSVLYGAAAVSGATITITSETSGYTNELTSVVVGNATHAQKVIVPLEYTSGMQDTILTQLVGLIPVILVVALIIGVIYTAIIRRADD